MAQPKFVFTLMGDDGAELEVELPAKFEVCPRCAGAGTHVNPAIDGNGISREDFDADPDFHEAYMAGAYDIQCQTCKGERVVSVVDRPRLSRIQKRQLANYQKTEDELRRDEASEAWLRRAESGERW
jgi:hypothetical protein